MQKSLESQGAHFVCCEPLWVFTRAVAVATSDVRGTSPRYQWRPSEWPDFFDGEPACLGFKDQLGNPGREHGCSAVPVFGASQKPLALSPPKIRKKTCHQCRRSMARAAPPRSVFVRRSFAPVGRPAARWRDAGKGRWEVGTTRVASVECKICIYYIL